MSFLTLLPTFFGGHNHASHPSETPSKGADLAESVPLKLRSRSNDVVDLEAQAGPAPLASPRIKAHHGESTARQQFQHQPPSLFMTLLVVAVWFASNIGIVLLNKHMLGGYGFRYPVFLTFCHMLACVILSQASHASFLAANASGFVRVQPLQSRVQFYKVSTLATTFLLSVVLGNVALRYIPVSFSQAMGAVTPAMTALAAFMLLGTMEQPLTYATLIPVMVGIVLAAGFEPALNGIGFLACFGASGARALKAVLQGILLSDQSEKLDSMNLLRLMSPVALVLLLPAIALLEPGAPSVALHLLTSQPGFLLLIVGNSSLAYIVNFTNFQITKYTSALTLQVLGCAKGVVATVVSVLLFRNQVTALGALGYFLTVVGVFAYSWTKKSAAKQ
ncbi:TPT-domain-containing protein [Coccomyxa subellipsoidea C-169]|uniref:TPT-domain-containing protein n=1 Tax=Coccomyxa subellipsoidea (strain C-169) TaxID=574566 RepID=I0Z9A0_COCSC|nr:TPT-domain-containing protein [Coccomyxa subellipsoidea C-169]EIE27219.1 TPT-domain-containing protein [Coccomyxa subellipsoidea C-169]|eukprot:XP_005651763.1 TPT-domain-containing protein [Coccomyxa subellipsoidea C-169]